MVAIQLRSLIFSPYPPRFYDTEVADMMVNCDESYIDVEGETKRCAKVMAFKMDWVDMYWTEPLQVIYVPRSCVKVKCQGHRSRSWPSRWIGLTCTGLNRHRQAYVSRSCAKVKYQSHKCQGQVSRSCAKILCQGHVPRSCQGHTFTGK